MGLYRPGEKVRTYDPLNEDHKVAPENFEQDSLYDNFKKDPTTQVNKKFLTRGGAGKGSQGGKSVGTRASQDKSLKSMPNKQTQP